ncbi:MAG: helix-turn-helix transcriptional regulator [Nitrospira sp.]|nr:helix-turn-helix transcriptional regulator [Nitrospira sp.]
MGSILQVGRYSFSPIAFNRKHRDFAPHDHAMLDLLRPHFIQGLFNAKALTAVQKKLSQANQTLEDSNQAIITTKDNGRIISCTPQARKLLFKYGLLRIVNLNWLPATLHQWLTHEITRMESNDIVPLPIGPIEFQGADGYLRIRLIKQNSRWLLLLEELSRKYLVADLAPYGLTPRETEAVTWLAQGKTNFEIGRILSISPRTVQKHLERVYGKLNVENRHSAMRLVMANKQDHGAV